MMRGLLLILSILTLVQGSLLRFLGLTTQQKLSKAVQLCQNNSMADLSDSRLNLDSCRRSLETRRSALRLCQRKVFNCSSVLDSKLQQIQKTGEDMEKLQEDHARIQVQLKETNKDLKMCAKENSDLKMYLRLSLVAVCLLLLLQLLLFHLWIFSMNISGITFLELLQAMGLALSNLISTSHLDNIHVNNCQCLFRIFPPCRFPIFFKPLDCIFLDATHNQRVSNKDDSLSEETPQVSEQKHLAKRIAEIPKDPDPISLETGKVSSKKNHARKIRKVSLAKKISKVSNDPLPLRESSSGKDGSDLFNPSDVLVPREVVVKYKEDLRRHGLRVVPTRGGGDCLYHAFGLGMGWGYQRVSLIRKKTWEFFEKNAPRGLVDKEILDSLEDFNAYVAAHKRPGTWGDPLGCVALAHAFGVQLHLYNVRVSDVSKFDVYGDKTSTRAVKIFYNGKDHYEAVVPI